MPEANKGRNGWAKGPHGSQRGFGLLRMRKVLPAPRCSRSRDFFKIAARDASGQPVRL